MEHTLLLVQLNCIWILGFILRKSVAVLLHLNLVYRSAGKLRMGSPSWSRSALLPSVPFQLEHSRTPERTGRFGRSSVCAECDLGGLGRGRPELIPFLL